MDFSFRFDPWFNALPRSPRDLGQVHRCVVRTGSGQRQTLESVQVEPGEGVRGDNWKTHEYFHPDGEVALVNVHVLRSLAGSEERMPESGDNLQVDLELSEENLPVGTLLRIGSAVLKVSPLPHNPCKRFALRFGTSAVKKVARANRRGRRGRGVYCTVESGGAIASGDAIRVERPGPP